MRNERVIVVDYDDEWPARFVRLRDRIWPLVADVASRIEHVGSTSVPGLAAKPIIDMTLVVPAKDRVAPTIERLATLQYVHRGTLGVEDREAFDHPDDLPRHHLYVCPEGTIGVVNQLAVRDYLRTHHDAAREYAALKQQLAAQFPHDIDQYVFGKTDFVLRVLRLAGLTEEQLKAIERINRPT